MKRSRRPLRRAGAVAALVALAAGCSSVLGGTTPTGDAGVGPVEDSGPALIPDEGVGFEGGALTDGPSVPQNLVVVHAAPGLPAFRLCFATALPERVLAVLAVPPLPDGPSSAPALPAMGPFPAVPPGTPGIFPGSIRALPSLPDFSPGQVRAFVVLASSLASETQDAGPDGGAEDTCDVLLGRHGLGPIDVPAPGRLVPGTDFWELQTFPAGAFASGQSYLLSVTGCLPGAMGPVPSDAGADADADDGSDDAGFVAPEDGGPDGGLAPPVSVCGASYDGGVNVQLGIAPLDTSTPADGGLGVQFAHRASALEATPVTADDGAAPLPASAGVVPGFFRSVLVDGGAEAGAIVQLVPLAVFGGDAGLTFGDAGAIMFSTSGLAPPTAAVASVDPTDPTVSFGVTIQSSLDASTPSNLSPFPAGDVIALPLGAIAGLSSWGASSDASAGGFALGQAYTFVLVGDPAQQPAMVANPDGGGVGVANPLYDGRGVHVVAFPNGFGTRGR